jgi:transposase
LLIASTLHDYEMAKAYDDDLRRKILQSYERKEGTIPQIASRFGVSEGYVEKLRSQYLRTGKMERILHRHGRKPKFTPLVREQLQTWLKSQPDLTLKQLQKKLEQEEQLHSSQFSIWTTLKKMGLRLKKSWSTPKSKTRRESSSYARRGSRK